MKYLVIPLSIMLILTVLGQMGLVEDATGFGEGDLRVAGGTVTDWYYDVDGNPKLNSTSLVPYDPAEKITVVNDGAIGVALFYNDTNLFHTYYSLYHDTEASEPVLYGNLGQGGASSGGGALLGVGISDNFAFIALIVGIIALVGVIGIQLFGSGESETSIFVIIVFTGLLALWTILSFGSYDMIVSIPLFGPIVYVVLTLMYSVGAFQMVAGVGSE